MDVESLSPAQRDALAQLQALTNGGDAEVAIGVLESVDWDVQVSTVVCFPAFDVYIFGGISTATSLEVRDRKSLLDSCSHVSSLVQSVLRGIPFGRSVWLTSSVSSARPERV